MKINKNSWHYRAMDAWRDTEPKSLCGYFWSVVFAPLLVAIFGILMMIGWCSCRIGDFFMWLEKKLPEPEQKKPRTGLTFFEVMGEFLQARKDQVCPLIEYVEDEDGSDDTSGFAF